MKKFLPVTKKLMTFAVLSLGSLMVFAEAIEQKQPIQHDHMQHQKMMENSLMVVNGWVRLTPPVSSSSAAYFELHNMSSAEITIVGVKTPVAESATIHNAVIEKSMVRMVDMSELPIPAGDKVVFAPGGMHLMLVNLKEALQPEKEIPVTFMLKGGESMTVNLPVKKDGSVDMSEKRMPDGHQHHH